MGKYDYSLQIQKKKYKQKNACKNMFIATFDGNFLYINTEFCWFLFYIILK